MNMMSIISKVYCSSSEKVLLIRRRPHVVNGGGFVVTDCSTQRVVFKVDGCGILGTKGELILRDGDGEALLLMCRKGGMVEALSIYKKWKGYVLENKGSRNLVFSLKEPYSCLVKNNAIRISIEPRGISNKVWDFEIMGHFPDKSCSIVDTRGNVVAQGGMVEALSIYKKWKGYVLENKGSRNLVFSLKEPYSCLVKNNAIRISIEPRGISNKVWDFEIMGHFPDKSCSIVDTRGNVVAQVGMNEEEEKLMESKDLYHVVVKPEMDQAFVFGVIAILDYIYDESTYC